jgi:hypothetical protein
MSAHLRCPTRTPRRAADALRGRSGRLFAVAWVAEPLAQRPQVAGGLLGELAVPLLRDHTAVLPTLRSKPIWWRP